MSAYARFALAAVACALAAPASAQTIARKDLSVDAAVVIATTAMADCKAKGWPVKAKWPTWTPTPEMLAIHENYKQWATGMPGGPDNPLGARAMYLIQADGTDQQFRIHGTPAPSTIGQASTSGCFRMLNIDVIDLYDRVNIGTRVVVPEKSANKSNSLFGL